jgi:hypothetical protein
VEAGKTRESLRPEYLKFRLEEHHQRQTASASEERDKSYQVIPGEALHCSDWSMDEILFFGALLREGETRDKVSAGSPLGLVAPCWFHHHSGVECLPIPLV